MTSISTNAALHSLGNALGKIDDDRLINSKMADINMKQTLYNEAQHSRYRAEEWQELDGF